MKGLTVFAVSALASAVAAGVSDKASALYFMTDKLVGNQIFSYPVGSDGLIPAGSNPGMVATGGNGSRSPSTMLTDALNSQSALAMAKIGDKAYLYAPNAGSNTITTLLVDPKNATNVIVRGVPQSTVGDFPNSVAVREDLRLACVSNSGKKSGVICYSIANDGTLHHTDKMFRPLALDPVQSNPPSGPFNTISQVFFNLDGTALYATVKGVPGKTTGYLARFPVVNGTVSPQVTESSPKGTAVLFGSVAMPNNQIFASDASFGAALLQVGSGGKATTVKKSPIVGNKATCWVTYSDYTGLLYTTDDGANQVVSFDSKGNQVVRNILKNGNSQMIEIITVGKMLYALSHGSKSYPQHIIVMKPYKNGTVESVQNFPLKHTTINVEGLVALT